MKKYRLIFTAFAVCAIVSSAFAYGTRSSVDLLFCTNDAQPQLGTCIIQTSTIFSTQINGQPVTPGRKVYRGVQGPNCTTSCKEYTGLVYNNQ